MVLDLRENVFILDFACVDYIISSGTDIFYHDIIVLAKFNNEKLFGQ